MNKLGTYEFVGLCVALVVAVIAIYAIVSLIVDYRQEAKKTQEMVCSLQPVNMTCSIEGSNDNYGDTTKMSNSKHFRDTGAVFAYSDCESGSTKLYESFQFVIVKSVIHTETREEIDLYE